MSSDEATTWTVLKLLEWTTQYFAKAGSESPRLDAELLLAEARKCERIELYTAFNEEPNEQVRTTFRELVRRRGEGTPVAHLLGRKEFFSLSFRVTEATLIPRPETEHLVIETLDEIKRQGRTQQPLQIADVGTGSGVIAVCLAKHLPQAKIFAIDISSAALAIAASNAEAHHVQNKITFVEGDLLSPLPEAQRFDFICSNPPYVSETEYAELDKSVRDFEPRNALVGGPTGTEIISKLLNQSSARLHPNGHLLFELSPMIAASVAKLLNEDSSFENIRLVKDLAGHNRLAIAKRVTESK